MQEPEQEPRPVLRGDFEHESVQVLLTGEQDRKPRAVLDGAGAGKQDFQRQAGRSVRLKPDVHHDPLENRRHAVQILGGNADFVLRADRVGLVSVFSPNFFEFLEGSSLRPERNVLEEELLEKSVNVLFTGDALQLDVTRFRPGKTHTFGAVQNAEVRKNLILDAELVFKFGRDFFQGRAGDQIGSELGQFFCEKSQSLGQKALLSAIAAPGGKVFQRIFKLRQLGELRFRAGRFVRNVPEGGVRLERFGGERFQFVQKLNLGLNERVHGPALKSLAGGEPTVEALGDEVQGVQVLLQ